MGGSDKIAPKAEIEDTYAEAFVGIFCRVIVTADDERTVNRAAEDSTATPSVVVGRVEGGVEKWLNENETPDQRKGALLQFWGAKSGTPPDSGRRFSRWAVSGCSGLVVHSVDRVSTKGRQPSALSSSVDTMTLVVDSGIQVSKFKVQASTCSRTRRHTTRNPRLRSRRSGPNLSRSAQRKSLGSLLQEPPRTTRGDDDSPCS